ncbi:MAG: phycobilisome protein [Cyanosarcina radialis HA8281-LM2]|jgi:hypothetical protein|nr:phycobilisome protein [Cyanosarcina radialis HA8281-LM2]
MAAQLNEKVKELIAKSKIVSFATWKDSHSLATIQIFQRADDEGRYLTDSDLEEIQLLSPTTSTLISLARHLRDNAAEIVSEARGKVLARYPNITEPGGSLYPPQRAENCWRDFWHFLRCMTYGIAGNKTAYTSSEGLHYMELLYQELAVPLDAMVLGLEGIKAASLKRYVALQHAARTPDIDSATLEPYFDRLIDKMKHFKNK